MNFLKDRFQNRHRAVYKDWYVLKSWRPYFLIAAIGFLLYSRTLFFDFTYFDDQALVIDNQEIIGNIENVGRIFADDAFFSPAGSKFYYRPLLNLSLMFDSQLGWLDSRTGVLAFFFHFSNIVWHLLAAALIFYLLNLIFKKRSLAFILALFFLVHPALVPAVAWIPGRNDSLLAVFILAAFALFLNFLEKPRLWTYGGILVLFFCALLTKESAIGWPLVMIFYFLFVAKGRITFNDKFFLIFGSGTIIIFWLLLRRLAFGFDQPAHLASLAAVWHNFPALFIFAGNVILPFDLSVLPTLADARWLWGILGLAGLLAAGLAFPPRRLNNFLFGFFWVGIFLLPSFLNPDTSAGFLSHRLYLSFFGFLLILGEFEWMSLPVFNRRRYCLIISGILVFLAILTIWHSSSFKNRLVFWNQAVNDSPHSPFARRNLGAMYYLEGQPMQAEKYYLQALALNPREPMAHNNLGVIYMDRKDYRRAQDEFYRELEINPGYQKAINNLVYVERHLQKTDQ